MEKVFNLMNTILKGTLEIQLAWAMIFLFLLSSIFMAFIFPLIFNYFIIPRIELRLGKRLERWGLAIEIRNFLGKFIAKCSAVASCVFFQYLILKFSKNPGLGIEKFNQKHARVTDLAKANYDVRNAPRYEIILSFLAMVNLFLWFFSVTIMLVFLK